MLDKDPADLRKEYLADDLDKHAVANNPFEQFTRWFNDATNSHAAIEVNACALATATANGTPSVRMVLLKGFDPQGFVFYTNYNSRKGHELQTNPQAALMFWWPGLERQVRIGGSIERVSVAESDEYFYSRPVGSQIGAIASPQSQAIESRDVLEQRVKAIENSGEVKRPEHWGGFRLIPNEVEFWQGRESRLHDRITYKREEGQAWVIERLAP